MLRIINKIKKRLGKPIWWKYCNIYKTAIIGRGTSIGAFSEIGDSVIIGNNCKIEAFCFIPKGVIIENNCFIGPRVTFTNDRKPPSNKWDMTFIEEGVSIGAGSVILPGITIGKGSLIGAGSVVTKSVPAGEIWFGNPSKFFKKKV